MMTGLRTWWVGRRRDDVADAARVADVARRRRRRRAGRGDGLHLVDAARPGAHLRAQPAGGTIELRSRWPARQARPASDSPSCRARQPACGGCVGAIAFAIARHRADGGARRRRARSHRRVLRRGRVAARRVPVPRRRVSCGRPPRIARRGHGWRAGVAARPPQRRRPARAAACSRSASSRRRRSSSISVDAFRRGDAVDDRSALRRRRLPAARRRCCRSSTIPNSREGREALGLADVDRIDRDRAVPRAARRRCELPEPVRADEPAHPRRRRSFIDGGPLRVPGLARRDRRGAREPVAAAERDLAARRRRSRSIADANSMTYVLHKPLGDDIVVDARRPADPAASRGGARRQHLPGRAADVGGELPARCFPEQEGYRFLLVETPPSRPRPSPRRSSRRPAISAPTRCRRPSAWRSFTRREHVPLDVPDARRPRAAARHDRARGGAAAQRARAAARAGAARRGRLPPRPHLRDRARRERCCCSGWGLAAGARLRGRWPSRRPSLERGGRLPPTAGAALLAGCGVRWRACYRHRSRRGRALARRRCSRRWSE